MARMGQDIDAEHFDHRDFRRFERALQRETQALHDWVERGSLSERGPIVGLEAEAWLVDAQGRPAPHNEAFLARLDAPEVVTELARFNVELNVAPQPAAGLGLARLADDLQATWKRCHDVAAGMGLRLLATGILPSATDADMSMVNLSPRARYRALNEQMLRQRHGRPVQLRIEGPHGVCLAVDHRDVMLEGASTSFQVHLQMPSAQAVRVYNAAQVASAPVVALSANSPFLFGCRLWHETRIPLFEQALSIGSREDGARAGVARVGFGSGYAGFSLLECFRENLDRFEPLLPMALDDADGTLPHLRLHNGTIWRWNRPLLGFDPDGQPHLRLEHRPMAAGPTLHDMMANLAFTVGLIASLCGQDTPPEQLLPFEHAQGNFYAAARDGMGAELRWLDGRRVGAQALLLSLLQPAADGLARLGVASASADDWLETVRARAESGRNGAAWQLAAHQRLGGDLGALTRELMARQAEGAPVHTWT
jgi:gamma-glutamyl:cysteine ligase YbdK (ATP-grasp superfamily)